MTDANTHVTKGQGDPRDLDMIGDRHDEQPRSGLGHDKKCAPPLASTRGSFFTQLVASGVYKGLADAAEHERLAADL